LAETGEQAIRKPADGGLWYAVLVLIVLAPSQFSYALDPKHGPFVLYADLLAALLFMAWAVWVLVRGRLRELILPPAALWALLVVAVLSAAGATSLKSAAVEIVQLGLYFVAVFAMFADVVRGRHRLGVAVKALGLATTVVVLWGLYHYFTAADAAHVQGPFGNRNVYSAFLAMVLPLFFGTALWVENLNQRIWYLGLVIVGAFTMLAGPQFWCLLLVLLVVSAMKSWQTTGHFLAVTAVFLALTLSLAPRNYQALVKEVGDPIERGEVYKDATAPGEKAPPLVKKRWLEWQPALNMLGENFLLGVGVGNYQVNIGEGRYYGFLPNAKKTEPDTNNLYLVIASSTGFTGLVCFVAFLGYFMGAARRLRARLTDSWGQGLAAGLTGAVYAIVLVNLFSSLFVRGNSLIWALLLAMIAAAGHGEWGTASVAGVRPSAALRAGDPK